MTAADLPVPSSASVLVVEDEPPIADPFARALLLGGFRPTVAGTGAGIIAGYMAVLLGPTFYLRRRLGARRWRRLHRLTPLIWVLAAVHTLARGLTPRRCGCVASCSCPWDRSSTCSPFARSPGVVATRVGDLARGRDSNRCGSRPTRPGDRR
jgi:hypothetical protein